MGPVRYEFSEAAHTVGCSASAPAIVLQVLSATLIELTLTGRVLPARSLRLAHELQMVLPVFREIQFVSRAASALWLLSAHNLLFTCIKG